jgi:predicted  nucleic acid-binding Zn-ribbon protein
MRQQLDTIVELQDALTRLREADQRLHGIPDWMRELHDEHSANQRDIDALQAAAEAAAHDRRAAEAVTADAQEKLKKYQQQINKVSTQREYGALLQEIDTVKTQITASEEQAFAALERAEKAQKELVERREAFAELDQRYKSELARWEAEKPAVAKHAEELRTRVGELRQELPRNISSVFDRILARHPGGALAPVKIVVRPGKGQREWHCGACNYLVRPQAVVEIRNSGNLVQCESCKRILFLEEETA